MAEPNDPTERPSFERRPKRDPQNFRPRRDEEQPAHKFAKKDEPEPEHEDQDAYFSKNVGEDFSDDPHEEESDAPATRRPYQEFPELRTLRRWSILTRWYMRGIKHALQFWDWDVQENLNAMANWRPTQKGLWRFSTLTGVISLLLTLLLFWQYQHPKKSIEPMIDELASSVTEDSEPEILRTTSLAPALEPPQEEAERQQPESDAFAMLNDDKTPAEPPPEEKPETTSPARPTFNFDNEPVVEPRKPAVKKQQLEEIPEEKSREEEVQSEVAEPVKINMPPAAEELERKPAKKPADPPALTLPEQDKNFELPDEKPAKSKQTDEEFPTPSVKSGSATRVKTEPEKEEPTESETVEPITLPKAAPKLEKPVEETPEEEPLPTKSAKPEPVLTPEEFPEKEPIREEVQPVESKQPDPLPEPAPIRQPTAPVAPLAMELPKITINRSGSWLAADPRNGPSAVYSMILQNDSDRNLADLQVVETLPPGTKFKSAAQGGQYNATSHTVSWKLEKLTAHGNAALSVTVIPQVMTAQTSRIQVLSAQNIVGQGSWTVTHSCPPTATATTPPPATTQWIAPQPIYSSDVITEAVYEW